MSKTVDERVVSMQFDNSKFEKNVQTSMSTIDKLKQKLNFSGTAKSFKEIDDAAKKVDLSGLSKGIETVRMKFSGLQVVGATALANLTNSAIRAGEKIASALTIKPPIDGLHEYELQIDSTQTIMANTGDDVKTVNKALDELNDYADLTIYNFTEMTKNVGTFTAALGKGSLKKSTAAIKGIGNWAAYAGAGSADMSRATYQLGQALSQGSIRLRDWVSIENTAGMAGKNFQEAFKETARSMGIDVDKAIKKYGNFRESLKTGWLSAEVFMKTMDKFSKDKAMTDAATKVKTFSQLISTTGEILGTGWATTWRLVIGDFDQARNMWTSVNDVIVGFINKVSDARNAIISSALSKNFKKLSSQIQGVVKPVQKASKTLYDLSKITNKVINGDFGNGEKRFDALTKAGINYYKVQNKVNSKLGDSKRYTEAQIKAQDKLISSSKKDSSTTGDLTKKKKELIKELVMMNDEQLKNKNYSEPQIKALKELKDTADKLGMPINELIDNMDELNGRWLLLNSFKNIGKTISSTYYAIKKAREDTFGSINADNLFDMIAGFHKATSAMKKFASNEENMDKLTRSFKGLFASVKLVGTVFGGAFSIALKLSRLVLDRFDISLLDVTANVGDAIVKFNDFITKNSLLAKVADGVAAGIKMAADAFKYLFNMLKSTSQFQDLANYFKKLDFKSIGINIIAGIRDGLNVGISSLPKILADIGLKMLDAIKKVLGIHSPSKKMYEIAVHTLTGFANGTESMTDKVIQLFKDLAQKISDVFSNFNWSSVFAGGISVGLLVLIKKITDVMSNVTAPLEGVGKVLSGAGEVLDKSAGKIAKILNNTAKVVKSFANAINAQAFKMRASAIKDLAVSIGILAASVYLLAQLDTTKLWSSIGALAVLVAIMGVLAWATSKLNDSSISISKTGFNVKGIRISLLQMGIAVLLISEAVKIIGKMDPDEAKQGFDGLAGIVGSMVVVIWAFGKLTNGRQAKNMDKLGVMMKKLSTALILMAIAVKLIGKLEWGDLGKGALFVGAFVGIILLLANFTKKAKPTAVDAAGKLAQRVSVAVLIMAIAVKMIGLLSPEELIKGVAAIAAFYLFIKKLVASTTIAKDSQIAKISGLLMAISVSMLILAAVTKIIGTMSIGELAKGAACVELFGLFIKQLVKNITITSEEQMAKIAGTLLAVSVAIAILAGVCVVLSLISLPALAKGVAAVGILGALMIGLIKATKGSKDAKANIIAMTVAIGIMAAAVAALSMIDFTKLAGATEALGILMGIFALMILASNDVKGSMGTIITMGIVVAGLAGIIYLLAGLPVNSVLAVSASLSLLLLSLTASMVIIEEFGTLSPNAMGSVALMTLVVAGLAGVLYLVQGMNPEAVMPIAVAISTLLLSMTSVLVILTAVGALGPAAFVGIGALATLIVGMGALMVALGALIEYVPQCEEFLDKGIEVLGKIGKGIGEFAGNLIAGFGEAVAAALPKIAMDLSLFMMNLQPFILGAKQIDSDAVSGVMSLVKMILAVCAAELIETITSWLTGGTSMSKFAEQMDSFADAIIKFSNKISGKIDNGAITSAALAGKLLADMTKSIPGSGGLMQFLAGEKDLKGFGDQLVSFADAIIRFSNKVSKKGAINVKAVEAAANAGKIMTSLQNEVAPTGGAVQFFTGDKDLGKFGQQLNSFGLGLVQFSKTVSEKGAINTKAIETAANAGKIMTSLQESVVPTGGVIQFFTGDQDLGDFGEQLELFGVSMGKFSASITAAKINNAVVASTAMAAQMMIALQKAIPESHFFDGKVTLDDFGEQIADFGDGMKDFMTNIDGVNISDMKSATEAATNLVNVARNLIDVDEDDFSRFDSVYKIGEAMKKYSDSVNGINLANTAGSIQSASRLTEISKIIGEMKFANLDNFKKISTIGDAMRSYAIKVTDFNRDEVAASITSVNNLVTLIRRMSGINVDGAEAFKSAVETISTINMSGFGEALNSSSDSMVKMGTKLMSALSDGLTNGISTVSATFEKLISGSLHVSSKTVDKFKVTGQKLTANIAIGIRSKSKNVTNANAALIAVGTSALRNGYDDFASAGSYLVSGFCNGIKANDYRASQRTKEMASLSYLAVKKTLGISSPSKVFAKLGRYLPEGLAVGIDKYSKVVGFSTTNMANNAITKAKQSLSKIIGIIDGSIDTQPSIRPVLDLSDVKTGINALSGMFGTETVGLNARVRAINDARNDRQNGSSDHELLSAIKDLRGDLASNTGVTLNVQLDYNAGADANDIANDIAYSLRQAVRRGL